MIDPEDDDTPFIWLALRRDFSDYSMQKTKVLQILGPITYMLQMAIVCAGLIAIMVLILHRQGVIVIFLGIYVMQVAFTSIICIG